MAYQTIRDLVRHVQALHGQLRTSIRNARQHEDDERSDLLLELIDAHESALERAIETVEHREGDAVLNTWLQYEPNAEVERALRRHDLESVRSGDEIMALVLETENALIRLYELLRGAHSSPSVQSFFTSLLEMEDSAVRRSARVELESGDA